MGLSIADLSLFSVLFILMAMVEFSMNLLTA
jgi:hypothetical protein